MLKVKTMELAAEIVTSYVGNNSLPRSDLPGLIQSMHAAVQTLVEGRETAAAAAAAPPSTPAVSVRKSITPDYLICLEDGKQFKSLRRHLTTLGMTPEQYRAKWSLPPTYPMVAPNYAAKRSALAKSIGLGQWRERPLVAARTEVQAIGAGAPPAGFAIEGAELEPSHFEEGPAVGAAPTTDASIEAFVPAPPPAAKRNGTAKPEGEPAVDALEAAPKRKPGRPRKTPA